uniref:Uncharacterized protein n=1 Tax=Romanomermis culicivorax TaxID=13658 RepID=A0A915JDT7_ROMCU
MVTWTLTNLAYSSSEDSHLLNKCGATCKLIELIRQTCDLNVRDQAMWTLSNVAGDCATCRTFLLDMGFLDLLVSLLDEWTAPICELIIQHDSGLHAGSRPESRRTAVWAVSNMCRGRIAAYNERYAMLVPVLARLRDNFIHEKELMVELCWVGQCFT